MAAARQWALPSGLDSELIPAGILWDAVKVPAWIGDRVLARLGDFCGAVIRDPYAHRLYWLVPTDTAIGWAFPENACVQILSTATWVAIPSRDQVRSTGPHWVSQVEATQLLTPPDPLHRALDSVIGEAFGPRRTTQP
jgi:hypothetical protein